MSHPASLEQTKRWILCLHWSVQSPSGWRRSWKPKLWLCVDEGVRPSRLKRRARPCSPVSFGFSESKAWSNHCPLWTSQAADQIKRLYDLFLKVDATQVEVNPLGETPEGQGTRSVCVSVCFSKTCDYHQKCHCNTLMRVCSPADLFSVSKWPQGACRWVLTITNGWW